MNWCSTSLLQSLRKEKLPEDYDNNCNSYYFYPILSDSNSKQWRCEVWYTIPVVHTMHGFIQVVGLKSGLHTGAVMLEVLPAHALRLAQCSHIQLDIRTATSALSRVQYYIMPFPYSLNYQ